MKEAMEKHENHIVLLVSDIKDKKKYALASLLLFGL
jgi:hypothetical protein